MTEIIELIKGAKNKHPLARFVCACGNERTARATSVRRGIITSCAKCAKAAAAKRGGEKRRLDERERIWRDRWSTYKANARAKGFQVAISLDEAKALFVAPCDYCGGVGGGIDRIDSAAGYIAGNVAPCCAICNYAKRDLPREAFLRWVESVYEYQSLLQRDRPVLLRMVEQLDGQRLHQARKDQRQVDCRSNARASERL